MARMRKTKRPSYLSRLCQLMQGRVGWENGMTKREIARVLYGDDNLENRIRAHHLLHELKKVNWIEAVKNEDEKDQKEQWRWCEPEDIWEIRAVQKTYLERIGAMGSRLDAIEDLTGIPVDDVVKVLPKKKIILMKLSDGYIEEKEDAIYINEDEPKQMTLKGISDKSKKKKK